jgi:hypothetical protein
MPPNMTFRLYFTVKGKQYVKTYKTMTEAENAKRYVAKRGATEIELRVCMERNNNENI